MEALKNIGKTALNKFGEGEFSKIGKSAFNNIGQGALSQLSNNKNNDTTNNTINPEFYSKNEIDEIKVLLNEVLREKFPENKIEEIIGNHIDKLFMNENNIEKVKDNIMLSIFNNVNVLISERNFQYALLKKLLQLSEIQSILNSIEYSDSDGFLSQLKIRLIKGYGTSTNVSSSGGGLNINEEEKTCIKNLFYTKLTRLSDIDIPDNKIIEIFIEYVSEILRQNTSKDGKIYQKIVNKMDGFTDTIFNSMKDIELQKYIFIILLENNKDVLERALHQPVIVSDISTVSNSDKLIRALYNGGKPRNTTRKMKVKQTQRQGKTERVVKLIKRVNLIKRVKHTRNKKHL